MEKSIFKVFKQAIASRWMKIAQLILVTFKYLDILKSGYLDISTSKYLNTYISRTSFIDILKYHGPEQPLQLYLCCIFRLLVLLYGMCIGHARSHLKFQTSGINNLSLSLSLHYGASSIKLSPPLAAQFY